MVCKDLLRCEASLDVPPGPDHHEEAQGAAMAVVSRELGKRMVRDRRAFDAINNASASYT